MRFPSGSPGNSTTTTKLRYQFTEYTPFSILKLAVIATQEISENGLPVWKLMLNVWIKKVN